jgi:dihydrodipicolinate synthase/N-acetylneuraminate lyase
MNSQKRYPAVIMGTCVIPWTSEYQLDEPRFRKQVQILSKTLTKHLYIFGTAGEGYAVTDSQFEIITRIFQDEARKCKVDPTVGIISLSLPTIIERIEKCRQWGIHSFQLSLPSWGALNDKEVDIFFEETCGRFPDCQFLHYNLMRTKRLLTGSDYKRLAEKHSNLVATKNTSPKEDFLIDLLEKAPQLQHFLSETGYALMRDRFECGLLISIATTNPERAHLFFNARGDELKKYLEELKPALKAIIDSVHGEAHMDGVFDKILYKLHDAEFPLRVLPPYISVMDAYFDEYKKSLKNMAPAWVP